MVCGYLDFMHVCCIEMSRPSVVDATQSRLIGLLTKAKRYIVPFDRRMFANVYTIM